MSPDWQSDGGAVTLYCADCLMVLPTLTGVDACVTDPFYGINGGSGKLSDPLSAAGFVRCILSARHPCPKPIRAWTRLLDNCVGDGATVLDPFMGSGTTGVACIRTGRRFIGIERDPIHFATALDRIKRELAQGRLF